MTTSQVCSDFVIEKCCPFVPYCMSLNLTVPIQWLLSSPALFAPKRNFSRISEGLENCLSSKVCVYPVLILHSYGKREFNQSFPLCKSSSSEGAAEFKTVAKMGKWQGLRGTGMGSTGLSSALLDLGIYFPARRMNYFNPCQFLEHEHWICLFQHMNMSRCLHQNVKCTSCSPVRRSIYAFPLKVKRISSNSFPHTYPCEGPSPHSLHLFFLPSSTFRFLQRESHFLGIIFPVCRRMIAGPCTTASANSRIDTLLSLCLQKGV